MPRNRVQHQKGLSDDAFERLYPDEEACRKAWFAWRWPEGFKCPRCAASEYCEIRDRQLLQCRRCRYQTSLIAGTVLQGTKLPMRPPNLSRAAKTLSCWHSNSTNIRLTRQKSKLFQGLALQLWFAADKDSLPTDSGVPPASDCLHQTRLRVNC